MKAPRVIIVAKRSAYTRHIEEEQDPIAQSLIERRDPAVANWLPAHRDHVATLEEVKRVLDDLGAHTILMQRPHAAFDATDAELVVAVGGDGTLLAASHNVHSVPVLGVNSAPQHSVGYFCGATRENVRDVLGDVLSGKLRPLWLTRMKVTVNGRVRSRRVLNETLYSHSNPAATSNYIMRHRGRAEEQRSSGVWVGPAAGSTAAQLSAGGRVLPLGSRKLQVVVREAYLGNVGRYRLLRFIVNNGEGVSLKSKMQDARMFLDGPYKAITLGLGDLVRFSASDQPLAVLGLHARRRTRGR